MTEFIISPAYGRDYRYTPEVLRDFEEQKDFVILKCSERTGRYLNMQDVEKFCEDGAKIEARFCRLTKAFFFTFHPEKGWSFKGKSEKVMEREILEFLEGMKKEELLNEYCHKVGFSIRDLVVDNFPEASFGDIQRAIERAGF